jgi:hypothetical protein
MHINNLVGTYVIFFDPIMFYMSLDSRIICERFGLKIMYVAYTFDSDAHEMLNNGFFSFYIIYQQLSTRMYCFCFTAQSIRRRFIGIGSGFRGCKNVKNIVENKMIEELLSGLIQHAFTNKFIKHQSICVCTIVWN